MTTHWKKLKNPDYLGAYSLDEKELIEGRTVEILTVKKEFVKGSDGKESECTVAYLKAEKPFILNSTNCKMIEKVLETPYIEQWEGKRIVVYGEKIKAFGEQVQALRVKNVSAKLPELTPSNEKVWQNAIAALKSGKFDIAKIKSLYTLTPENESALIDFQNT